MSSITNIWETGVNNGGNGTDNNQYYITDTSSSTKRLTIQRGTGKIGIGTNLPITIAEDDVKLDVNGSINLSGNIYKNGVLYVSNSTTWVENETKTKIYYTAGNVGINTNNPLELLDVNGTIKATNIIANGSGLTALNATNIETGTISTSILPNTIEVANFIGSGEYLNNLNASALNINSGKINNSVLPSTISVSSFQGDGSGLINLDASKISTGNINNNSLPANISVTTLAGSGSGITNLQAANISGNVPNSILPANIIVNSLTGIGSNITQLNASEIKTGKISSSAFLPDTINVQYLSGDGSGLSNIDAVKIAQGKLNNNLFNNDINISGTLSVGNLQVSGTSAIINTNTYQTENLEIINNNATGPSLIINHNSTFNDLLQISANSSRIFTILKTGNVGIGGTTIPNSIYKLDVDGAINSSGNISSQKVLIRDTLEFYKSSTYSVLIKLPQTISNYTITLPNAGPSANNILKSDSSGNLSWVNINESPTLENVYTFFDNTDFEKTTNITLKNIKSSKLIPAFNSTQFELFGDPQIIRIKDNVLTAGNVSLTSINDPLGADVNTLNIVNTQLTDSTEPAATPSVPKQIPTDKYQYHILTFEGTSGYTSTTDGNQRTYNINFPENVVADILVVGGGGGGGASIGGGGGAGGLIFQSNITLSGQYTILVGKGGLGATSYLVKGTNGKNSKISGPNVLLEAYGGGGSQGQSTQYNDGYTTTTTGAGGFTGGSGGGGSRYLTGGGDAIDNPPLNTTNPNQGDQGYDGGSGGYNGNFGGGGGGGAGGVGGNMSFSGKGGDGGLGLNYSSTFGTSVGDSGWFASGGGGQGQGSGGGGIATLGGGGYGSTGETNNVPAGKSLNALSATGGGGGGAQSVAGNGGSGIVIIRYYVVSSITHKYLALTYQPDLTFTFRQDESPYSWQEAYDEAIANGKRMPTKTELQNYLKSLGYTLQSGDTKSDLYPGVDTWTWVVANNAIGKDAISLSVNTYHWVGKSHYDSYGTEFYNQNTNSYNRIYCEVSPINTTYTVNFPVKTTCDILAINNTQYIKTSGVTLNGNYSVVVGSTSKIQKNSADLYVPNTNLNITDSITGSSVTYTANTPIVIIRYFMTSIISDVVTTQNVVPVGYLKFDGSDWNVENSGILTSKVLHNELCLSRYLSSNIYSMINIYEYSVVKVVNGVNVPSDWYEINNENIIYIAKEGYTGAYPTYQNNFVGNILKIRLKSCSLENVYKRFLIDHNSYTHKINCTIKNVAGTNLYNSTDLDITKATFFSKPELFGSGINLSTSNIPVNVKHILELKLYVSYDASTNSIATTKQQTDKFYLFYEQF